MGDHTDFRGFSVSCLLMKAVPCVASRAMRLYRFSGVCPLRGSMDVRQASVSVRVQSFSVPGERS